MSIAVIIPVYNDAKALALSLQALRSGHRVPDELIVVDDASTDDSAATAQSLGASLLRLERNRGPAAARNAGVAGASSDILIFLDADTCVRKDTIARLEARLLGDPSLTAVIGSYDDETPEQDAVSQFRNLSHHFVHGEASHIALTFWSGCGSVRKASLLSVGGFDTTYLRPSIEDIELGYRLSAAGDRILLDPAIQVTHLKRWTIANSIRTDILDRGAPWFELLLRRRDIPNDLNVSTKYRLSTACVAIAWLCLLFSFVKPHAALFAFLLFGVATLCHANLLRFLIQRKGPAFLAASISLLLLQQSCNVASVLLGLICFAVRR